MVDEEHDPSVGGGTPPGTDGRSMGIRDFAKSLSETVSGVAAGGVPVVLTKHGRPVAAIVPIDSELQPRVDRGGVDADGQRDGEQRAHTATR